MNLLIVNVDQESPNLQQVWEKTGFLSKLKSLGDITAIWDSKARDEFEHDLKFSDSESLKKYILEEEIDALLLTARPLAARSETEIDLPKSVQTKIKVPGPGKIELDIASAQEDQGSDQQP